MNHIEINSAHGGQFYALFYFAAFLTGIAVFIISGIRHKYPIQKLWLIAATGAFFFILGNKFFAVPPQEWKYLFAGSDFTGHSAKTMLGGLIGLIFGSILAVRWLRTDSRVLDHAAIGLPIAMAVTRVGCLLAGCCFGKPSALPWAICYPAGYHAFNAQMESGLLHQHDTLSMPVHPTQVYDIICCLVIALIIWRTSQYWKAKGNRLLFAIFLYGCTRFVIEFFRDPASNSYAAGTWFGIKYIQWILLGGIFLIGLILVAREWKSKHLLVIHTSDVHWSWRPALLLAFLVLIYSALYNWFDILEKTTISFMLIPAVCMTAWKISGYFIIPRYRLMTAMLALSCLLFMSQTYIPEDKSTKVRYFEIGTGGVFGNYHDITADIYKGTDCAGNTIYNLTDEKKWKYDFQVYGLSLGYNELIGPNERLNFSLNGYYGFEDRIEKDSASGDRYNIYAINPSFSYSWKNFGLDIGFHLGHMTYAHTKVLNESFLQLKYETGTHSLKHNYDFFPEFGLRIGPQKIVYFDAHLGESFPVNSPLMKYSLGVASGLGKLDGTKVGIGYSTGGFYVQAILPIEEKYVIEGLLANNFNFSGNSRFCVSVAFSYRFGYKTIKRNLPSK